VATNLSSERISSAYAQVLVALRAVAIRDVTRLWPLLRVADLDQSWPPLQAALEAMVSSRRGQVAVAARGYLADFRRREGVRGRLKVVPADGVNLDALRTSLRVTGPVTVRRNLSAGASPSLASERGLVAVSGSVARIVLNGGRKTILDTVAADRRALGWMRVAKGDPCAFCAMLTSRGPVYKNRATAGDPRDHPRFHDFCACTIEPVYSADTQWPDASLKAERIWAQSTGGVSGKDAIAAFRVAYGAAH